MPTARTAALLYRGSSRSRARASSSGSGCAVPVCHRPCSRRRTRASARILRMYWDRSPNSETNQNELPTLAPPIGVTRGCPLTRPVV